MEVNVKVGTELFAGSLPSIAEVRKFSESVHSSNRSLMMFREEVEAKRGEKSAALAVGVGLFICGSNKEAIEVLGKAGDSSDKFYYLGLAQRKTGAYEEAVKSFDKAGKAGLDEMKVRLEKAGTYREAREYEKAREVLAGCKNLSGVSSDYHYELGRLVEVEGDYAGARASYEQAVELSGSNKEALFHLAYRCDLSGDEEAAMDYYKQLLRISPVHVNALLNLAVLYEDRSDFSKASQCVELVLDAHPNHGRARMFQKDIGSSKTMFFDEEKAMKRDRKNKILETPISDFELSVRSRNCLKKMNIHTIGDLLRITESELLSYKNFGETSLKEIKAILDIKSLRLGMQLEDLRYAQPSAEEVNEENAGILSKPVTDLNLSVRARKCLEKLNMRSLGDVTRRTEAELLGCKNFGVTSLNEIKKSLATFGIGLRQLD